MQNGPEYVLIYSHSASKKLLFPRFSSAPMTTRAPTILSISYDESLLQTREWILKAAGFEVTSAHGFTAASEHCRDSGFDLVIIGHSLPSRDSSALIAQIKSHNHTRVLALRRPGESPVSGVDHSVVSSSAEALIEGVHTVLKSQSGKAQGTGSES